MGKPSKRKASQEDQGRVREKKTKVHRRGSLFEKESDGDEDPARIESQQLLATSKVPDNQHETYMESFTATVDKHQSLLQGLIDREAHAVTKRSAANHMSIVSILGQGLSQPKDNSTASTRRFNPNAAVNPHLHPACGAADSLLETLEKIIAKYDNVSHDVTSEETSLCLGQGWDTDRTALHTLFEAHRQYTEIVIDNMLQDQTVQKGGTLSKGQDDFWATYAATDSKTGGTTGDSAVGWAIAARRLKRSIARVVRELPVEE